MRESYILENRNLRHFLDLTQILLAVPSRWDVNIISKLENKEISFAPKFSSKKHLLKEKCIQNNKITYR